MKKFTTKKTLSSPNHRGDEEEYGNNKNKEQELEILRAVAQAWHGHFVSGSSTPTANECDTRRLNFMSRPSRFKLEAMNKASAKVGQGGGAAESKKWDFNQSLLDSYELVSVARRLERGGLLSDDEPFDGSRVYRKKRESKSSLRNLLNLVSSSKRFSD